MQRSTQRVNILTDWFLLLDLESKRCCSQTPLKVWNKAKLNVGLELRQRAYLLLANISPNKISLPQGQNYTAKYREKISFKKKDLKFIELVNN